MSKMHIPNQRGNIAVKQNLCDNIEGNLVGLLILNSQLNAVT